jgi:hypothetical protein
MQAKKRRCPSIPDLMTFTGSKQVRYWAAGGAAVLALAGALLWWRQRPVHLDAIMILASKGEPALTTGLREEIVSDLERAPGLRVVSGPLEQPAITGVLDVQAERSADRIQITAELRRSDGHHYWTRPFDRPLKDLPGMAEEIAAGINPKVKKRAPRHKPLPAAYEAYLEGRADFGRTDAGGLDKAIAQFEIATVRDPDFALAWAWLSIARQYQVDRGAARPNEALPEARDAADRAVALDPDLTEAHLALGIDYLQYDWQWHEARAELDRAAQLGPGSSLVAYWNTRWHAAMGRGPEPDFHYANLPPIHTENDARNLLDNADDIRVETYISPAALALVACQIHDAQKALYWLDVAYEEHCVQLPYVLWNPELPRSDPRFADLLRRMRLQPQQTGNGFAGGPKLESGA